MESEWFREAVAYSLKASAFTTSSDDNGPPEQRDPRFHKLVEGIMYSRRLILSYHVFIVGIVCVFSAINWTEKGIRWRKRRAWKLQVLRAEDTYDADAETIKTISRTKTGSETPEAEEMCSSGSSTVEGSASPPSKASYDNEETPLLPRDQKVRPKYPRRSLISTLKSLLIYQPPPIPVFNKMLPSNGTSIVIIAFLALNFFYMFYHINFNLFELFVLADRFGLVFVANLPLLYLLAAKTQPLRLLTGRSYESLNIFHRRLGELLCLEAFLHCAGMLCVWYTLLRHSGRGLIQFLLLRVILVGLGAFFSYEILYFTSLASFRQRWYELFLILHIFFQLAALIFVFFHHSAAMPYVGAALCIFFVDRLVYRMGMKSITVEAQTKILEDEETVRISTTIALRPKTRIVHGFGRTITTGWKATDHVFLTVPSLSRTHILQAHPFTIASAAPRSEEQESRLEFLIRAQDGFSRDLLNAARLHKTITVRLDGPYGSSHARHMIEGSDLVLLVAGGSGVAVCWPLLQHLIAGTHTSNTEIAPLSLWPRQKIILIWVIHESTHISWIGRNALGDAEYRGAEVIIPRATEEIGRPDLATMINDMVDIYAGEEGKRTRIVASGPDSMGRLVRNTSAKLVRDGRDVEVAVEKFGW